MKKIKKVLLLTVSFVMLLNILVLPEIVSANTKTQIRVGTFNIAANRKPNIVDMNAQAQNNNLEVMGVQEVDMNTSRNNYDMLERFIEQGYFKDKGFQKSIEFGGGEYGNGVLSTLSFTEKTGGALISTGIGEARSYQRSVFEKDGKEVAFYTTHLTHENKDVRQKQLNEILKIMDSDPIEYKILTGDFNTDSSLTENYPMMENYNIANGKDGVWFDTYGGTEALNSKSIDNIITSRNIKVTNVNMVSSKLSDHNLLYADCELLDEAVPSTQLLDFLTEDAKALDESDYSKASYAVLAKAIKDASNLNADATQKDIDKLIERMREAVSNLEDALINLALHKKVEVSSTEVEGQFGGELAVDGIVSNTSRWSATKNVNEQWLQVDLGEVQLVNKVILNLSSEAVVYNMYVSEDGEKYEPILQVKDGGNGSIIKEIEFDSRQVRYIKYEQKEPCPVQPNGNRYSGSIYELEAYYDETLEPQPLIVNDSKVGTDFHEFDFQGKWKVSQNYPDLFYDGDEHWYNFKNHQEGDVIPYVTMKFKGTGIELYGNYDKVMGIYEISIDDEEPV